MQFIKDTFSGIDYKSSNVRMGMAFLVPLILYFITVPGNFFEIDTSKENKFTRKHSISYSTSGIHAVIFSVLWFIVYYFYISKTNKLKIKAQI